MQIGEPNPNRQDGIDGTGGEKETVGFNQEIFDSKLHSDLSCMVRHET
jgi:hypothetical protein